MGAGVSVTRNRQRVIAPGGEVGEVEFNNFEGHLDASWELDVFGRIRSGRKAETADTVAAEESRRAVLVSLLGELGRTYANLRGLQLRLVVAEKNIRTQQETLEVTQARSKAGLATDLDVERALAQLEATRSGVPSLQSGIQAEIHRLSVLLAEDPGALVDELSASAPVPSRRGKSGIFPEIRSIWHCRASGGSAARSNGVGNFFSTGPAISVPIFTGGRIRSTIRVQDERLQQTVLQYRSAVLSASRRPKTRS